MNQASENYEDLVRSIGAGADGAVERLHDLVRQEVSAAAGAAFVLIVNKLRMDGLDLMEYGVQSEDEIHYRAPLVSGGDSKTLVLALDVVVTVGVIPQNSGSGLESVGKT